MTLKRGGMSTSWLAESRSDRDDDQTSDGWRWLRRNAAAEQHFSSTWHQEYKWNIRHTYITYGVCGPNGAIFSGELNLLIHQRRRRCEKNDLSIDFSVHLLSELQICINSQLFHHKTHFHVKRKKKSRSLQHLPYFLKGIKPTQNSY